MTPPGVVPLFLPTVGKLAPISGAFFLPEYMQEVIQF